MSDTTQTQDVTDPGRGRGGEYAQVRVNFWTDQFTSYGAYERAKDALQSLDSQLLGDLLTAYRGTATLDDAPYVSYDNYLDEFGYNHNIDQGDINIILYDLTDRNGPLVVKEILDRSGIKTSCSGDPDREAFPFVGFMSGEIDPAEADPGTPVGCVHAGLLNFDDNEIGEALSDVVSEIPNMGDFYRNMVIHEVLHALGAEHYHGENSDGANTPMISGYAEHISNNDPPSDPCSKPVLETSSHTNEISECTEEVVQDKMAL
jgi:hypothetical protein